MSKKGINNVSYTCIRKAVKNHDSYPLSFKKKMYLTIRFIKTHKSRNMNSIRIWGISTTTKLDPSL